MNMQIQYEVTNFLNREALLLDTRQFHEWLQLFTDDLVYRMPIRVTTEEKDGSNIVNEMTFFEESKSSLTLRVERLGTSSAWAENPAPRTRHFVSNIVIEPGGNENEIKVRSWFNFLRSRADDLIPEQLFGERIDVLRKLNGEWKVASRTIQPDQTTLGTMNLSMFL